MAAPSEEKEKSWWRPRYVFLVAVIFAVLLLVAFLRNGAVSNREILTDHKLILYLADISVEGKAADPWSYGSSSGDPKTITCNKKPTPCLFTHDRERFSQSDVILFDAELTMGHKNYSKSPHQILGAYFGGALLPDADAYPKSISKLKDQFNFVSAKSVASAVPIYSLPWSNCTVKANRWNLTSSKDYSRGKTKLAAFWAADDDCHPESNRQQYLTELKKLMELEVMGGCQNLVCRTSDFVCIKSVLEHTFSFVFVIERDLCQDHISDVLIHMYVMNVVPVVVGTAKYSKLLPPGTYIDANNFTSPKQLADHLHAVRSNATLYNRLLENRKRVFCPPNEHYLCRLCQYVRKTRALGTVRAVDEVWNDNICPSPREFYAKLGIPTAGYKSS